MTDLRNAFYVNVGLYAVYKKNKTIWSLNSSSLASSWEEGEEGGKGKLPKYNL